jgi:hypothetical protein
MTIAAQSTELAPIADDVAVRLAPVDGAPLAATVTTLDRLLLDAEVLGEEIDGSPRWYFVIVAGSAPPVRGFVHSSVVEAVAATR